MKELVKFQNVTLNYEVHFDRTNSLKEYVLNLLHKRKYVDHSKGVHVALNNVSFGVCQGDRLGIIGRNGAGKSSLLKVIARILKPSMGAVNIDGTVQPLIEISAGFNPEFSGRENIYLNGYMIGFTKNQIKEREQEIISFAEIGEYIDVPVKYYSSGMAVRLAFAIATSIEPEILVVDEMLSAGDASFIKKAQDRMVDLIGRAKALIVVSHDLELVKKLCEKVIVLQNGAIVFEGPAELGVRFYLESNGLTENI